MDEPIYKEATLKRTRKVSVRISEQMYSDIVRCNLHMTNIFRKSVREAVAAFELKKGQSK